MLLVFEILFLISESTPSFPALLPTFRLLDSFLLQTSCLEMSASLGKAWLHLYCYLYKAFTFILYYLFGIALWSICFIFLLCCNFSLALINEHVLFNLNVNKYLKDFYFYLNNNNQLTVFCVKQYKTYGKILEKFLYIFAKFIIYWNSSSHIWNWTLYCAYGLIQCTSVLHFTLPKCLSMSQCNVKSISNNISRKCECVCAYACVCVCLLQ